VRFRYRDAKSGALMTRRLHGVDFLRLLLKRVLPALISIAAFAAAATTASCIIDDARCWRACS